MGREGTQPGPCQGGSCHRGKAWGWGRKAQGPWGQGRAGPRKGGAEATSLTSQPRVPRSAQDHTHCPHVHLRGVHSGTEVACPLEALWQQGREAPPAVRLSPGPRGQTSLEAPLGLGRRGCCGRGRLGRALLGRRQGPAWPAMAPGLGIWGAGSPGRTPTFTCTTFGDTGGQRAARARPLPVSPGEAAGQPRTAAPPPPGDGGREDSQALTSLVRRVVHGHRGDSGACLGDEKPQKQNRKRLLVS